MDWTKLAETVGRIGLPLLGTALGGPAGGAVGGLIANALGLGSDSTPDQIEAAIATDPTAASRLRELELNNKQELERLTIEAEIASIQAVNRTYQTEIASSDRYVRWMRPTFGYVVAGSILVEVLIAVYVAVFEPLHLPDLATLYNALSVPQSVACAVLGVYLKKRSDEKMASNGFAANGGLLSGLLDKVK